MVARDDLLEVLYGRQARRAVETPRARPPPVQPAGGSEFLDLAPPVEDRPAPFPLDALPIGLTTFVLETARALEVEPEMVAIPALVCLGAAVGDTRCLWFKRGYQESAMLWAAVVARPGSVKTAAVSAAAEPLYRYERYLDTSNIQAQREYEREQERFASLRPADREGQIRPEPPAAKRQIVGDATMEELAYILRDNPRGLLMLDDELVSWVRGMNQYKAKGSDRSHWLSIWSSKELFVDRRSAHGQPVRVWRPFVSVVGSIQPDVLRELRPEDAADDGFIDRILFAWPAQRVRRWTDADVAPAVIDDYRRTFAALLALQPETDSLGYLRPVAVRLDPEARRCWIDRYNQHHSEMAAPDFDPRLYGAYAKLDGYAARIALLLQLVRWASEETERNDVIELEAMEGAWQIATYFRSGAARVYGHMTMTKMDRLVQAAIEWMERHQASELSSRDCARAHIGGIKSGSEVKELFRALVDRGYGLSTEERSAHGRASLTFRRSSGFWGASEV